jgi:serine/threonine protein kinase
MRTIGKYEVVEKIGEGGFGTIFKGFDPHIRRFVAIKTCSSEEQEIRNRFFHEAQIAGNLQHRHIVTVYEFGVQDGVPYLVQEYLSGEDLDRKIKRKEVIPLAEKLLYLIQVARGLEYAHSKNVVHRDIKPANVRILEDGTAKIMDFGIAKLTTQDTGLTQTGTALGTAAYLAPEQISGQPIGPGTDIFSWGVTAWELLSFKRPFSGDQIPNVLFQILKEQPTPLRDTAPDVPAEIEAVIDRCLEKKPERRYASCTELLRDLDHAIQARRAAAQSGLASLADDSQGEIAATRAMGIRRPAAQGARTAPIATAHAGLGDLDLEGTGVDPRRTPHSISSTQAMRSRGFQWGGWAAAAAGVLLLAGLGWWLIGQTRQARESGRREADIDAKPITQTGSISGSTETVPLPTVAPPPPTPTPTPSVAPTPTPTPRPSYLVVPAAWSRDVWVTVNKQRRRLDKEQRFEVPPATGTKVSFEYDGAYADRAQSTVRVEEGETTRVAVPLQRPGLIQVQQKVGTPMGRVVLDGADLGTPIVRQQAKPGAHTLRIEPSSPAAGPIEQQVEVQPGKKLIVTFDLSSGRVTAVVGELPAP